MELAEVDQPVVKEGTARVRVQAAALNAGDTFTVRGHPWLARFYVGFPRPKSHTLGWDVSGRVDAVGEGHARRKVVIAIGPNDPNGGSMAA